MVGAHHAIFSRHRGALNQWQQITLHTLARHFPGSAFVAPGYLVNFINENNAALLQKVNGAAANRLFIDQLGRFLVNQQFARFGNRHLAVLALALPDLAKHAAQLLGHLFHARRAHHFKLRCRRGDVDFDAVAIELTLAQFLAESLSRGAFGCFSGTGEAKLLARGWYQNIQNALFSGILRARSHLCLFGFTGLFYCNFGQIANDGVDVLPNVTDFGELGRLDLDKRRIGQARQTACDLGFPNPGGADHQNILGRNFMPHGGIDLLTPPAIAQGDRHGAFGIALTHNMAVQLGNDFLRCHDPLALIEGFDSVVHIGIDAQSTGNFQGTAHNVRRGHFGMLQQRHCSRLRISTTRSDRDNAVFRLQHIPIARNNQGRLPVCYGEHRLQAPQYTVGTPLLAQLYGSTHQVPLVFFQLGFKTLKQGKRVGGRPRKTRQYLATVEFANFTRRALHHDISQSNLPVTTNGDLPTGRRLPANTDNRSSVKYFHGIFQTPRHGQCGLYIDR